MSENGKHTNNISTRVRLRWRTLGLFIVTGLCTTAATGGPATGPGGPECPTGSFDDAFQVERDLPNCIVGAASGKAVGQREGRFYTVTCPRRVSANQAVDIATAVARNTPAFNGNPIPGDFAALGLTPQYAYATAATANVPDRTRGIRDLEQYRCGASGVATRMKVEINSFPTNQQVANSCRLFATSGPVSAGSRQDLDFRCRVQIRSNERNNIVGSTASPNTQPPWVQEVAAILANISAVPTAGAAGLTTCLLASTDIQCNPCRSLDSSDKLVVRLSYVAAGASCPAGTVRIF